MTSTRHSVRRLAAAAFATLLIASSCSSGAASTDTTGTDDAVAFDPATAPPALEALRLRLVVGGGCASGSDAAGRTAWLAPFPPGEAADAAAAAWTALTEAEAACGENRDAWAAALVDTVSQLGVLEDSLGHEGPPIEVGDPASYGDVAELSSLVVSGFDRVHAVMQQGTPSHRSPHWFGPAESLMVQEQRRLAASDEIPSVILTGNSQMKYGTDVALLREQGFDVFDASVDSASPPVQAAMMEHTLDVLPSVSQIVWDIDTHWLLGQDCVTIGESYGEIATARTDIFRDVDEAAGIDPYDLVLGPDPLETSYSLPGFTLPPEQVYSDGRVLTGRVEDRIVAEVEQATKRYAAGAPLICEPALSDISATIERWATKVPGVRIVVVTPPMSDELALLHVNGRAGHDSVIASLEETVTAAGAEFFDFSSLVPIDGFYDLTLPNETGRDLFTQALMEVIG